MASAAPVARWKKPFLMSSAFPRLCEFMRPGYSMLHCKAMRVDAPKSDQGLVRKLWFRVDAGMPESKLRRYLVRSAAMSKVMSSKAFVVDRLSTPIGPMLLVTDEDGVLRALDFEDHEARMKELLRLQHGAVRLERGGAPKAIRSA